MSCCGVDNSVFISRLFDLRKLSFQFSDETEKPSITILIFSSDEDINTWVDITGWEEKKVDALSKYVSQFSSGWSDYKGPELSEEEEKKMKENLRRWFSYKQKGSFNIVAPEDHVPQVRKLLDENQINARIIYFC